MEESIRMVERLRGSVLGMLCGHALFMVASSTVASWVAIVVLMAASTAVAVRAGARGLVATRRTSG